MVSALAVKCLHITEGVPQRKKKFATETQKTRRNSLWSCHRQAQRKLCVLRASPRSTSRMVNELLGRPETCLWRGLSGLGVLTLNVDWML